MEKQNTNFYQKFSSTDCYNLHSPSYGFEPIYAFFDMLFLSGSIETHNNLLILREKDIMLEDDNTNLKKTNSGGFYSRLLGEH